ncbi:MAG: U32 family peptidase [Defluviitaleaceae bacterium]|nr:U32 family peptidase [Defluviitaleaceae bacterium]
MEFVATCLTEEQARVCAEYKIKVMKNYTRSLGEITPGCVTDFSVHCFNSATLEVLRSLGVLRVTLHPELNLAQIRDIVKPIPTEVVIYGKIPLMRLGNPLTCYYLTDRTNARFYVHGAALYNSVPIFMADKMGDVEKTGVTHGRLSFTDETAEETKDIIKAYMRRTSLDIKFTRGKFNSKV